MTRKNIPWNNLPHNYFLGHGVEGLVLQLSSDTCIKVYSPERAHRAEKEFANYRRLHEAGFLVPEAHEIVNVQLDGARVKLPGKCEFMGIGLYTYEGIESVDCRTR